MANLGICRKCKECKKVSPALIDDSGRKLSSANGVCDLVGILTWNSEVPEDCPYRMEHMVTTDAVADLAEEEEVLGAGQEVK